MTIKNISAAVLIMSLFGFITNFFGGCTYPDSGAKETAGPAPFPEGTRITALYISETGDMRHPYYILRETADGVYMKKHGRILSSFIIMTMMRTAETPPKYSASALTGKWKANTQML